MKNKFSLLIIFLLILVMLLPLTAAASIFHSPEVPKAAKDLVRAMDKQLKAHYLSDELTKRDMMIVSTVPVWIEDFTVTNPLSRQMAEELTSAFASYGYSLTEIRRGYDILIEEKRGEFLLTRDVEELAQIEVESVAVITGTYTMSKDNIRYNITLLHAPSNEVLAKASATVPIRDEILSLLYDDAPPPPPLMPSVRTKLQ